MAFWSSQTLKLKLPGGELVVPYDQSRVVHSAYELGVGPEAFVTSNLGEKTLLAPGRKIVIPPGQFGLLVTRETIRVPPSAIAFISIRARIKFQGLVNVSGFHVDPGFHGQLKFAVYNAGSHSIILYQDERVFMIWFADLDNEDENPYPKRPATLTAITAEDVAKIHGEVASPAELKQQLDSLQVDLDKKFHASEQTRLFNRSWIMLIVGILIAVAVDFVKSFVGGK